jgi:hypothetical protein
MTRAQVEELATGDTLFAEQGAHGIHLSSLITMSFEEAEQIIRGLRAPLAAKLRWPDTLFGDLHALDALEAEE